MTKIRRWDGLPRCTVSCQEIVEMGGGEGLLRGAVTSQKKNVIGGHNNANKPNNGAALGAPPLRPKISTKSIFFLAVAATVFLAVAVQQVSSISPSRQMFSPIGLDLFPRPCPTCSLPSSPGSLEIDSRLLPCTYWGQAKVDFPFPCYVSLQWASSLCYKMLNFLKENASTVPYGINV